MGEVGVSTKKSVTQYYGVVENDTDKPVKMWWHLSTGRFADDGEELFDDFDEQWIDVGEMSKARPLDGRALNLVCVDYKKHYPEEPEDPTMVPLEFRDWESNCDIAHPAEVDGGYAFYNVSKLKQEDERGPWPSDEEDPYDKFIREHKIEKHLISYILTKNVFVPTAGPNATDPEETKLTSETLTTTWPRDDWAIHHAIKRGLKFQTIVDQMKNFKPPPDWNEAGEEDVDDTDEALRAELEKQQAEEADEAKKPKKKKKFNLGHKVSSDEDEEEEERKASKLVSDMLDFYYPKL
eukprot:gnl/MRDRNA2_/MRDRNA2_65278_c0_seq1.p1 gnl/MRDRNA2_/MRDRNA2_65278_c0~~gnl/MRDRNA2_/MRDRNA2_65278_c0_seq1.p1  ORF type:complete len:294 (-),score=77.95 gnl/MRDRNA2_/MRDRNA2_65278_c0_seq1:39-920(-)